MKEYFFLMGKEQSGPFTIEEIADKGLTYETLIWTEGMDSWQKLKDIHELVQTIKPKSVPPPPPLDTNDKISKTEVSDQLKVTTEKTPNPAIEAIKSNKKTLTLLILWCGFHLFALLMSYSRVSIFNDGGEPRTDKFWPFLKIWEEGKRHRLDYAPSTRYNGIFYNYDWSEFAFYVGGAIIIYLLVRISNRNE